MSDPVNDEVQKVGPAVQSFVSKYWPYGVGALVLLIVGWFGGHGVL